MLITRVSWHGNAQERTKCSQATRVTLHSVLCCVLVMGMRKTSVMGAIFNLCLALQCHLFWKAFLMSPDEGISFCGSSAFLGLIFPWSYCTVNSGKCATGWRVPQGQELDSDRGGGPRHPLWRSPKDSSSVSALGRHQGVNVLRSHVHAMKEYGGSLWLDDQSPQILARPL